MPSVPGLLGGASADAGPPPEPMRSDQPVGPDTLVEAIREVWGRDSRDGGGREPREGGYALTAIVRTGDGPAPPKGPEVNVPAIDAARRRTEPRIAIEMNAARARLVFSGGFVVPAGTELRAREDRFGHLLLWPGETTYRVAAPGSLRALLGERRLDVAPISPAQARNLGEGPRRLGLSTRRVEVATRAASAVVEVATVRDAGAGGALVCRFLLELMGAPPSSPACAVDEVPMHAELRWSTRGGLTFEVVAIARRADLPAAALAAPPSSLSFVAAAPPVAPADLLVSRSELAAFRTAPVDVPAPVVRDAQVPPPEAGLILVNATDEMRVVWLDGVAVAWVAPGERLALPMLLRGRYALQWRTFLGDAWDAPETVVAPGAVELTTVR